MSEETGKLGGEKKTRRGKASAAGRWAKDETERIPDWDKEPVIRANRRFPSDERVGWADVPTGDLLNHILREDGLWKKQQREDGSLSLERGNPNFLSSAYGNMVAGLDAPLLNNRDPNAPLSRRETQPFTDPNMTGQFTPGSYTEPVPEELSAFDKMVQSQRDSINARRDAAISRIDDYKQFALGQLEADEKALFKQMDSQDQAFIGASKAADDQREADYQTMIAGLGGEEEAAMAYLAEMGVQSPAAYTTEPTNQGEALLGVSFAAGAEAGRQIDSTFQFAANQLRNIHASGFAQSNQDVLSNALSAASSVHQWVNDSMSKIDMAILQNEISEEEAAMQLQQVAAYAMQVAPMLNTDVATVIAANELNLLDDLAKFVWEEEPDELYLPYEVLGSNPNREDGLWPMSTLDDYEAYVGKAQDNAEQRILLNELGG